ncbi:hypothetical protein Tco_1347061 [Tanacetum coccineum]
MDILFQPVFDEYFKPSPSAVSQTISATTLPQDRVEASSSTTIDQDAPSPKRGDGVASIKRHRHDLFSDGVWNLETTSRRGQLKEDLESST